jgi:hypothetical protein
LLSHPFLANIFFCRTNILQRGGDFVQQRWEVSVISVHYANHGT